MQGAQPGYSRHCLLLLTLYLSQLAVQHAVDMAARAGREALTAAVIQAEEWCELRRVSGE